MESKNARNDANDTNVLRPSLKQWLPGLVARMNRPLAPRSKDACSASLQTDGNSNVHLFPAPATRQVDRVHDLELENAVLIGDCAEWSERCGGLENNLQRAREQVELAVYRMSTIGESIPATDAEPLTALQESYQNFDMAVTLAQSKLEKAYQRLAALQEKRASIAGELAALAHTADQESPEQTVADVRDAA